MSDDTAPDGAHAPAHRLAVIGAGVMGTGITTLAVGRGLPVVLVDVDEDILDRARANVANQLRLARMMGKLPRDGATGELVTTTRIEDIAGATAVVEAVTELASLKAKVLAEASAAVAPGTLLISNTSAVPIDEQADSVLRPEDLAGIHFMNPPYMIHTAELIRGPRTGEAALAAAGRLLADLGQNGVVVGDGPGFVINRILQRMINEAARIVAEGIAPAASVDAAFEGCLGHTTGPLATADLIGLDNVVDSLRVLHERTGDAGYEPCALLLDKVTAGDFGRKTGRGFYEYGGHAS
ncbi:3-hydroxyacyl-CoA dehydrogenase family protein [Streptomyces subrutilus]|uniref:3-hydroxyacyl-CoA dehydrogenase family protein n=1 Tax=Streptomyces subrutilus TaxID=36818 RepID=UPI002E0DE0F8|nr:3-hydroxyacyl-CoA dehydrogenase family protein [Streptomyces subrutilus]